MLQVTVRAREFQGPTLEDCGAELVSQPRVLFPGEMVMSEGRTKLYIVAFT